MQAVKRCSFSPRGQTNEIPVPVAGCHALERGSISPRGPTNEFPFPAQLMNFRFLLQDVRNLNAAISLHMAQLMNFRFL
jgi:hypothetical protein